MCAGVADGVGGWRTYGVDPSIFPNCLMDTCGRLVEEGRFQPNHLIDMLAASYQEILENKMPQIGKPYLCGTHQMGVLVCPNEKMEIPLSRIIVLRSNLNYVSIDG